MNDADITINIKVNPDLDIDSVANNLLDMLEDMMEIEEVEVEYE